MADLGTKFRTKRFARAGLFLCAGAVPLFLMSLGIEPSHAAVDNSLPKPLLKEGTLQPEAADGILRYWTRQKKYLLVIAVNQTDVPKTELPFAQVDRQRIVKELTSLGYQPLDKHHPLFTGKDATRNAIMASFDEARPKGDEATLVVYYTGHGAVGAKDLWLQTAGQVKVGDGVEWMGSGFAILTICLHSQFRLPCPSRSSFV